MKGKVSVSEAIVTAIIDRVNTGQLLIYSIMELFLIIEFIQLWKIKSIVHYYVVFVIVCALTYFVSNKQL